jgi:hypothetical protein
MDSSVTRSKSDGFVFLSGHVTERIYAFLPNSTDDLVARSTPWDKGFLQKTSYWLPSSAFKLKEATSKRRNLLYLASFDVTCTPKYKCLVLLKHFPLIF